MSSATTRKNPLRSLAAGTLLCIASLHSAAVLAEQPFRIDAGNGSVVLREFGAQSGMQILFDQRMLQRLKLPSIEGKYEAVDALTILLEGTGLTFERVNERTIAIRRERVHGSSTTGPANLGRDGATLLAVNVPASGSAIGDAASVSTDAIPGSQGGDGTGSAADGTDDGAARVELQEILVTARKREESLLKVPQSITAVSAIALRDNDVRSVYELQNLTANFSFEKPAGRRSDRPVIRGQSNLAADSNASFYVDGIFVVGSISSTSMDAIERIEVLRGPQAAIFGRASFAGAINYVTKQPSDEFEGSFNTRFGSHDDYKVSGWARGPIIPGRLQYFVAANWDSYGGEYRNQNPGTPADPVFLVAPTRADFSRVGSEKTRDVVGKLRWQITDALQANAKVSRIETDDAHMAVVFVSGSEVNCLRPVAGTATARSRGYYCGEATIGSRVPAFNLPDFEDGITSRTLGLAAPAEPGLRRGVWRNSFDLQFEHRDWHYLAQVAQDDDKTESVTDFDLSLRRPLSGGLQTLSHDDRTSRSAEIRVTSPADARLRGLFGLYGYRSEIGASSRTFASSPIVLTEFSRRRNENRALFGQIQYDLTPALELTVEARVADDEKEVFGSTSRPARETFKSFTPRFSAAYKLSDTLMLYGIVAKGNKPGDFNASAYSRTLANDATFASLVAAGLDRVKEEKQVTYELGAKGTFFGGRVAASADVFYIDWTNQALVRNVDVVNAFGTRGVAGVLVNAGKSHVSGAEIEVSAKPVDRLTLAVTYGLARAILDRYNDDEITITTGVTDPDLLNGGNARGHSLPFAPDQTASASATWRQPLQAGSHWFASTNLRFESRKYDSATNYQYVGDLLLWNARIGFETPRWNVATYFNNILDEDAPTATIRGSDFSVAPFPGGSPRSFQLGLRRGFEYGLTTQFRF